MTIEKWANNANAAYEQKRIESETQKAEKHFLHICIFKAIEWGCVAFTMLVVCGKLFEWIDTTTFFDTMSKMIFGI